MSKQMTTNAGPTKPQPSTNEGCARGQRTRKLGAELVRWYLERKAKGALWQNCNE